MSNESNPIDWDKWNYCKYGHYEEFEVNDPEWPKCKNEAYLYELEQRKGLDCE